MLKRIGGILLAAIMLLSLVAFGSFSVLADEETTAPETTTPETTAPEDDIMRTSDECLRILKLEEGFSFKPYWDNTQYTVGFGTRCPDDMVSYYLEHGITEEAAEVLLRNHLDAVEQDLDRFLTKHNVTLTQNEFDAILLFSYNCGTGWCYSPSGTFYNAIKNRATGNDLVRAFALWCSAGGQIQSYLLRRRLSEANMYLNAIYDQMPPDNYCYVLYDANGGVSDPRSQGYNAEWEAVPYPVPTYEGHTFQGWYTERTGGEKVTKLDMSTKGKTFYAHWLDAEGNEPDNTEPTVVVKVTGSDVSKRKGPGTNYTRIGYAQKGEQLTIVETASGSGYRWGRFTENGGGWIALMYTNYESALKDQQTQEPDNTDPTEPTEPEVTEPTEPEATEPPATEPPVTEPPVTEPEEPEQPKVMGTVKVNEFLRVRKGPSTGYEEVARLKPNDRVEILEQKVVGATVWGRITQGWVSMDYIKLDSDSDNNSGNTNTPAPTPTPTPTPTGKTGTIVNCSQWVRIRSGAGTSYEVAGYYYPGDKVTVTEEKTVSGIKWGKTEKGWVSMDYVKLDTNSGSTGTATPAPTVKTGVIYNCSQWVRIRSGAGTSYTVAGYYYPGDKVTVTEEKTVGGIKWGKTDKGWVSMEYVKLTGTAPAPAPEKVIKTITADCLNVREKAGTGHKIVGYLYYGAKVEILETVTVDGITWGRVSNGWISMEYAK